eukprot:comp13204_c0_seq1/m.8564 comp13204_c0_seq1/g.8564  ORF comp13204_c0_seq1/g.8564 comp13204_c0_seq1/m.8564 type:complete len:114 (-) comp13204_c0_seq1:136-477(-)
MLTTTQNATAHPSSSNLPKSEPEKRKTSQQTSGKASGSSEMETEKYNEDLAKFPDDESLMRELISLDETANRDEKLIKELSVQLADLCARLAKMDNVHTENSSSTHVPGPTNI